MRSSAGAHFLAAHALRAPLCCDWHAPSSRPAATPCVNRLPALSPICCAQGMSKAYRTLIRMLEMQYGGAVTPPSSTAGASGSQAAAGGKAGSGKLAGRPVSVVASAGGAGEEEGMNISALLQNPQTNAAAFLALVVFMAILWRLAAMNPMISQAVRGVATAAVGR